MKQSAAVRPEPTFLRKAAIINGGVRDHVGKVVVEPIPNFDLNRTIFQTLSGAIPRYVMKTRVAKEVYWSDMAAANIQHAYDDVREQVELPEVSSDLMTFLVEECDFDVEHADGSFLDRLYFGFDIRMLRYVYTPVRLLCQRLGLKLTRHYSHLLEKYTRNPVDL